MAEESKSDGANTARNTAGLRPPWQPGQSGNPSGRPKSKPITDAYLRILGEPIPGDKEGRTFADALAQKMIKEALNGKVQAASEITDRVEGKITQSVSGPDGGPIPIATLTAADLTDDQLSALITGAKE